VCYPYAQDLFAEMCTYGVQGECAHLCQAFCRDGGTIKGVNEGNAICSYEDLERIHMSPYPDCVIQGVATVMASYSKWNGEPLHSSRYLLTDVLKGKLGFKVAEPMAILIY
jgi:hypothetical protein